MTGSNFADRLYNAIQEKKSPCIVGLDPRIEDIPHIIREKSLKKHGNTPTAVADAILAFNREVIDIVAPSIPAVKPQMAFYEMYGPAGMQAFIDTVTYAREKGLLVIADVKRNDIGSTVAAYSNAYLGKVPRIEGEAAPLFDVDAVTVNGYLGTDGIKPFLKDCQLYGKGIFVLVKTSNPSSAEFQNIEAAGKPLYHHVAEQCKKWGEELIGENGFSSVGVVVGATYPEEAVAVRSILPQAYFLVPGFGFQGGDASKLKLFFSKGQGVIINSSRGIIHAYRQQNFAEQYGEKRYHEAIAASLEKMNQQVHSALADF